MNEIFFINDFFLYKLHNLLEVFLYNAIVIFFYKLFVKSQNKIKEHLDRKLKTKNTEL